MNERILFYRLGALDDALPIMETSRLEVLAGALADMDAYSGPDT